MPDRFKEFLQNHKDQLDHLPVPKDLFDQVMDQTKLVSHKSTSRNFFIKFISIAASLLLVVLSYFLIQNYTTKPLESIATDVNNKSSEPIAQASNKIPSHQTSQSNDLNEKNNSNPTNISNKPTLMNKNTRSNNIVTHQKMNTEFENKVQVPIQDPIKSEIAQVISAPKSEKTTDVVLNKTSDSAPMIVSTLPIEVNTTVKDNQRKSSELAYSNEDQLIDRKIKKGLFSFLSKKSRKWSNNTFAIDPKSEDKSTSFAFSFKSHNLEFSKSFRINTNQ